MHFPPSMSSLGVVALVNTNVGAIGVLRRLLESAGFTVISAPDLEAFSGDEHAAVIVYDIGPPYIENWQRFERLRARPSMSDRRFVITAADTTQVERLAGNDDHIFEVINKDSDLASIVQGVKEATRARATRGVQVSAGARTNVLQMPERRKGDRRESSWSSNDLYEKLREKREQVEGERRRGGRRATDLNHDPHHHAA